MARINLSLTLIRQSGPDPTPWLRDCARHFRGQALFQADDQAFGPDSGGASALSARGLRRAQAVADPIVASPADWIRSTPRAWSDIDLVVDLGERIGSPRWWRGLATLGVMMTALAWTAPGIRPLPGIAPAPLAPAAQEEMRAIGIAPLAHGADTGRRIAATDRARSLSSTPERPEIDLVTTLGFGDGLARLLERQGASRADAAAAAALVAQAMPPAEIAAGTRIAISFGRRTDRTVARPLELVSFRARLDLSLAVRRAGGRLVLDRLPIAVDDTPMRLSGEIGGGLYRTARAAGAPPDVVADYIRAIAAHLDIGDLQAGDRYDLVFEHARAATGEVATGRLLYAGYVHGGKALRLLRWTQDGREQWFDAAGAGERREGFAMPVQGHETSGFGMRFHPILGFSRMHQGVDYGAPYGSPIVAASDGVVTFAGWHGGHGNFVQIRHDGGLGTGYGHMSSFVVRPGDAVQQGQLIGYVGSTGLSTGPHLHFEVYLNGQVIDPAMARFATVARISGADLVRFRTMLARLTALPPGGGVQLAAASKP